MKLAPCVLCATMVLVGRSACGPVDAQMPADWLSARTTLSLAPPPMAIPVLGVATIFHAGYLLRCIRSIDFAVETLVVIHNGQDPEVAAAIELLQAERPLMRVVHEPTNTGCAGGWNRIISANASAPWWLVVNDDIAFPPGALRNIASRVWSRVSSKPDEGHFKFWYQHGATGWSCFALAARAVREVGTFDENIFPVYFEDQDYEWRLEKAGLASVHIRDVLVVHGSEEAEEYESGSMTALVNGTGGAALRDAFHTWLKRGDSRTYMRHKWGALKPSRAGEAEARWDRPFGLQALPLSWWALDERRRRCILGESTANGGGGSASGSNGAGHRSDEAPPPCTYDRGLATASAAAYAEAAAAGPRPRPDSDTSADLDGTARGAATSSFARRLAKTSRKQEL